MSSKLGNYFEVEFCAEFYVSFCVFIENVNRPKDFNQLKKQEAHLDRKVKKSEENIKAI